jgi:hypothetical protein
MENTEGCPQRLNYGKTCWLHGCDRLRSLTGILQAARTNLRFARGARESLNVDEVDS